MTFEIAAVLLILAIALVLFVTEKLRMDVVALLVLSTLAVSGLLGETMDDVVANALAGFSNPAVITVWAMFILSAGLSATGVADLLGRQVLRLAGKTEPRIIMTVMLTAGLLSAVMNNIGVAALMLPVVLDISRRTGVSPSRLLMPMAYASLLGGLVTLVGTPPNLVASDAMRQAGHGRFEFFDFTPFGLPALVIGSLFVAFIGRHLLPNRMPDSLPDPDGTGLAGLSKFSYDLDKRRFRLKVADESPFHDRRLRDTGLGALLGMNVMSVERRGQTICPVDGDFMLASGDVLEVQGREEDYRDFFRWQTLEVAHGREIADLMTPTRLVLVAATVAEGTEIEGITLKEADFRRRFRAHVLSIRQGEKVHRQNLASSRLSAGDRLQLELMRDDLPGLQESKAFSEVEIISTESFAEIYPETETLLQLDIPADSRLAGVSVAESGLADALGLRILALGRRPTSLYFPGSDEILRAGDKLLVHGSRDSVDRIRGLQSLEHLDALPQTAKRPSAGSDGTVQVEVTLSPQSSVEGKSLRDLGFRQRYGLQVLGIWRRGRSWRSHLRNFHLEFGDALLLSGPRERANALASDPDFLVLSGDTTAAAAPKLKKHAIVAGALMLGVVTAVLSGWLPISLAAIVGATLMVVTGCLGMDAAYRAIDWRSVFLIACMIPLGTAMKDTGAAEWIARGVTAATGPFGPWGLILGLYLLTTVATTIVPTTALVLIMAHIGMDAAAAAGLPPQLVVMAIALAASASFTSPISHPANVLVMGPGGYRFIDYVKLGLCLAVVVMATVLPLLAWWWK